MTVLASMSIFLGLNASDLYLLVHHQNGEVHEIMTADGMTLHFDTDTLRIGMSDSPIVYNIDDIAKMTYSVISSVKDVEVTSKYTFTPDAVRFSMPGEHTLIIFDIQGHALLTRQFTDSVEIPHEDMPKGIVLVKTDNGESLKLVVK